MTQSSTTATQGRKHIKQRKSSNTNVAKPKSCLDYLQATDWETFLVRKDVDELSIFRILLIFDVGLLVENLDIGISRDTAMSTITYSQDIPNEAYKMQVCLYGGIGRLYLGFSTHDG